MKADFSQFEFIHHKLRELMDDAERCYHFMAGQEPVITSLYRIGDKGVHGQLPLRGCDLRMRNEQMGRAIADELNARWLYDRRRPEMKCAIYHDIGQGAHIHLQVHMLTEHVPPTTP